MSEAALVTFQSADAVLQGSDNFLPGYLQGNQTVGEWHYRQHFTEGDVALINTGADTAAVLNGYVALDRGLLCFRNQLAYQLFGLDVDTVGNQVPEVGLFITDHTGQLAVDHPVVDQRNIGFADYSLTDGRQLSIVFNEHRFGSSILSIFCRIDQLAVICCNYAFVVEVDIKRAEVRAVFTGLYDQGRLSVSVEDNRSIQLGVGVSADDNVDAGNLNSQLLVYIVAQVRDSNDFVDAQSLQSFDCVLGAGLVILEGDVVAR
ncbi:hypothetical protein D3C75_304480 [compost metagenome]